MKDEQRNQAENEKRQCPDCKHYFRYFCMGDTSCECKIYGSFQVNHGYPKADTCKDYEHK